LTELTKFTELPDKTTDIGTSEGNLSQRAQRLREEKIARCFERKHLAMAVTLLL
jgi:hypothetical protein